MTARAHIDPTQPFDRLAIHLGEAHDNGVAIVMRFPDVVLERIEPGELDHSPQPLLLREDHARALYEALAKHFGGAPDVATVRRDYDAERKRVDQMIGFLIGQSR